MKTLSAGFVAVLLLAGCSGPGKPAALQAPVTGKINLMQVQVTPSDADIEVAKASLFTAGEAEGIEFDSLFDAAPHSAVDHQACAVSPGTTSSKGRSTSPVKTASCCSGTGQRSAAPAPRASCWR